MKKSICLISSIMFIIAVTGCSSKQKNAEQQSDKKQLIGMANPVHESSAAEIQKVMNVQFGVPDGAEKLRYSIITGKLAQMDFEWNEADCTARIQPDLVREGESISDISGFYYDWSNTAAAMIGENPAQVKWTITDAGEIVGICIWQNKAAKLTYSISMKKNADSEKLLSLAKSVYIDVSERDIPVVYKNVSMSEGLKIAEKNPDAIILDVRRDDEYKAGHIPGARLLTMETITTESAAKVLPDKNQLILIYCRSGRRSKIAAQSLLDLGYTNLIEFGGILDYKGKQEK